LFIKLLWFLMSHWCW